MNRDRFLTGPLRWTSKGEALATWWLSTPLPRAELELDAQVNAHLHQQLFNAIAGHRFWIQGALTWTDAASVVDAMLAGVDLAKCPGWADSVEAAMDHIATLSLGRREFLLTIKLNLPTRQLLTAATKAAGNDVLEGLGMRPLPPSPAEYRWAMDKMAEIGNKIPAEFGARPATPAQIAWSKQRAAYPLAEPFGSPFLTDGSDDTMILENIGSLGVPHLDPSGALELSTAARGAAPVTRRWLRVSDDQGHSCVQARIVVSKIPRQLSWPDTEFLGRIDDHGVALDWTVTGVTRRKADALAKNRRSMAQLSDQAHQIDGSGDEAQAAPMTRVLTGARVLAEYNADLANDDNDSLCEVEPIVIATVAAEDAAQADDLAQQLVDRSSVIRWARPIGNETNQFEASQPGGVPNKELAAYRQITHSATMGTTSPITSHRLGDATGIPLGINTTSALQSLVLLEPYGLGADYRKKSPSMALAADQGGGKTSLAKTFFGHMIDRGAFGIATDTSPEAEWITFARSLGTSVSVIDFRDPEFSCDPLRCLPPDLAGPIAQSFLVTLLDLDAVGKEGQALAKMLRPSYLAQHRITSLGSLQHHLEDSTNPVTRELADRIGVFSDPDTATPMAASLFDADLRPAPVDAQVMIWRFYGIPLPTAAELAEEHLYRTLPVEKRLGRAAYALYARFARELCFRDPHAAAIQNCDEFHHQTSSPDSMRTHADFLRVGRHVNAFWCAQDQLASGFKDLRDLIRTRIVLRTTQPDAASDAADFLGRTIKENGEEAHDALVQKILADTEQGNGAGVMRDHTGQIGTIQTFLPFSEDRRRAADTAALAEEPV